MCGMSSLVLKPVAYVESTACQSAQAANINLEDLCTMHSALSIHGMLAQQQYSIGKNFMLSPRRTFVRELVRVRTCCRVIESNVTEVCVCVKLHPLHELLTEPL